jgi:hypothetical protein
MERDNYHLFDLMIKYLLQGISPCNIVYLINALFGRNYPKESVVTFKKTESVDMQGTKLTPSYSDIIVGIGEDDFVIEFQTSDDEIIGLRIFEYGFRYANSAKRIEDNGALIEFRLPEGCVIFWEDTDKTPDRIKFRLTQNNSEQVFEYDVKVFKMAEKSLELLEELKLLVLLPFSLLRFRSELDTKSSPESEEKRRAIAEKEKAFIEELEAILERSLERGFISTGDQIILLNSIALMHKELYQTYTEFQEVSMTLDNTLVIHVKALEQELKEAVKQAEYKVLDLWKQGYTPEEVEKLLAKKSDN